MQSFSSLITQLQNSQSSPKSSQIQKLSVLKDQILKRMQHIDVLNMEYKQKSQMSFMKSFLKIMDKLSSKMKGSVQAYQNIDQQIQKDPKCVLLRRQVSFFKGQKLVMEQTYQTQSQKLNLVRLRNNQLKKRREELKRKSINSHQKYLEYSSRNRSLSLKLHQTRLNSQPSTNRKKTSESADLPTSVDNPRMNFNSVNNRCIFQKSTQNQSSKFKSSQNSFNKNKENKIYTSQRKVRNINTANRFD